MKCITTVFFLLLLLCGCSTYHEFRAAPERYTSIRTDDHYVLQEDAMLLKYDYLLVPLVKPGIQLMPCSKVKESELSKEFAVIGHAKKGDEFKVVSYANEGGWIPCKGDWYMVNPMVVFLNGELKGKKVGISFLCDDNAGTLPFRTGKIYFARPNEKLVKKKA